LTGTLTIRKKVALLLRFQDILVIHVRQQLNRWLLKEVTTIFENTHDRDGDNGVNEEKVFHVKR
jgi:hypothetical protein